MLYYDVVFDPEMIPFKPVTRSSIQPYSCEMAVFRIFSAVALALALLAVPDLHESAIRAGASGNWSTTARPALI